MAAALLRRLRGVVVAREYVIFDYDCPTDLLDRASLLTPGIESPTVSPLRDANWVAVRVLVKSSDTNSTMDALYELGARAILVSAIHAARI
jgi:ATP phosphoribosyltransferase